MTRLIATTIAVLVGSLLGHVLAPLVKAFLTGLF
jgi:hypothetical protein